MIGRFSEIARHQAVVTRQEHRDELALRIVVASGTDADAPIRRLEPVIRDVLEFRASVEVVARQRTRGR